MTEKVEPHSLKPVSRSRTHNPGLLKRQTRMLAGVSKRNAFTIARAGIKAGFADQLQTVQIESALHESALHESGSATDLTVSPLERVVKARKIFGNDFAP